MPDLLEQLVKDGNEMIQEVTEQMKAADFLTDALEAVLDPQAEKPQEKPLARLPLGSATTAKGEVRK